MTKILGARLGLNPPDRKVRDGFYSYSTLPQKGDRSSLTRYPRYPRFDPFSGSIVRKPQEAKILEALRSKSILIRGALRIGKSSMLESLALVLAPHVVFDSVYWTGNPTLGMSCLDDFKRVLAHEIEQQTGRVVYERDKKGKNFLYEDPLGRLAVSLRAGESFFLLFDEFTKFHDVSQAKEIMGYLISSLEKHGKLRAVLVIHADQAGDRLVEEFFSAFEQHYIAPVSRAEVAELIAAPLRDSSDLLLPYVERIYELSGGIPIIVNRICEALIGIIKTAESQGDVAERINRLLCPNKLVDRFDRVEGWLKNLATHCLRDGDERILKNLARETPVDWSEPRLAALTQIGLVRRNSDGRYEINGSVLKSNFLYNAIVVQSTD